MDSLSARLKLTAGVVGVVLSVLSLVTTEARGPALQLRVYDTLPLNEDIWQHLRSTTELAFAATGIALDWQTCGEGELVRLRRCPSPRVQTDIVVRVVRRHDGLAPNHCGFAVVAEAGTGFVSLATDCATRLVTKLQRSQTSPHPMVRLGEVLGFALAHELAHVLLPGTPHSPEGIFAGRLNRKHWGQARAGRLAFLADDALRLRESAAARQSQIAVSEQLR